MANEIIFPYFPTHKDEVNNYVENLLSVTLKTNFEAEKLLLHSLLHMMFDSTIPREELTPHTVLHLLQMTAMEDDEGYSLLDRLFMASEERIEDQCVENLYWYIKETEAFVPTVIRLISVYQFYDNLFNEPIFSADKKTLIRYPNHLKDAVYSIPDGTERVASHAFSNNPHINTIKIPKTLKYLEKISFGNLANLKAFIVSKENKTFYSENGILYRNINNPVLIKYPPAIKNTYFIIPASVKKVKSFAFEGCNNLKEISFECGNIKLEDAAFLNCRHIDNIAILDGNGEMLNKKAFSGMMMEDRYSQENQTEISEEPAQQNQSQEAKQQTVLEYHTPAEIKKMFDDYIVGHEDAKKTLAVAVYSHIIRCNNQNNNIGKSNIILCGPTGCGKTEFARTIAKCLNVPFVTADATSITETGMKGNDPTDMLKDLIIAADNDLNKAQNGIIYIDEIDKLATYGENAYRESYSKGVQQGLLKIIEGGVIPLRIDNPMHQYTINFDTSNILFIVGGAFGNMTTETPVTKSSIGFVSEKTASTPTLNMNKKLEAKDFVKYGMTQEFMGRFPVIVQLKQLTENEIYRIMVEPKNSVITQYQSLVSCIGSKLVFEEELLRSIAGDAVSTGTGARGIRTVIEQLVESIIFDLPNKKNIEKVLVHKGMLSGELPKYIEHIKPVHTPKQKNNENRPKRVDRPNRKNRKPRQEHNKE